MSDERTNVDDSSTADRERRPTLRHYAIVFFVFLSVISSVFWYVTNTKQRELQNQNEAQPAKAQRPHDFP